MAHGRASEQHVAGHMVLGFGVPCHQGCVKKGFGCFQKWESP